MKEDYSNRSKDSRNPLQ